MQKLILKEQYEDLFKVILLIYYIVSNVTIIDDNQRDL